MYSLIFNRVYFYLLFNILHILLIIKDMSLFGKTIMNDFHLDPTYININQR
jgi:hypothetical protein